MLENCYISHTENEKYKLFRNYYTHKIELHFKQYSLFNSNLYPIQYDDIEYINGFAQKVKNIKEGSKVLILGLGLGLIPYYLKDKCHIDVVELDLDLINLIKQQNYLPTDILILNDNAYTFIPDKIYDWIIVDIFWDINNEFTNNYSILYSHYSDKITNPQNIYFPITL